MKDLKLFINENKEEQYNVPVKELYRIVVEQGIKDHESWDKDWEWEDKALKKPSSTELSIDGCCVIRCEIPGTSMNLKSGRINEYIEKLKEFSKKIFEIFKKYWDDTINVTRTYSIETGKRFYEFNCVFDKDTIIKIEYMGALKDLNKYKV